MDPLDSQEASFLCKKQKIAFQTFQKENSMIFRVDISLNLQIGIRMFSMKKALSNEQSQVQTKLDLQTNLDWSNVQLVILLL